MEPKTFLGDYLYILLKRRMVFITLFITIMGIACAATFLQTPVYEAVAKILIREQATPIFEGVNPSPTSIPSKTYFQTICELITRHDVIEEVVKDLKLAEDRDSEKVIRDITKAIVVKPVKETSIVDICMYGTNPQRITEIVNRLTEVFIEQYIDTTRGDVRDTFKWLTKEVEKAKRELQRSEDALQRFKERTGIISIDAEKDIEAKKLEKINAVYLDAKTQRLEAEARLLQLRKFLKEDRKEATPLIVNDPEIQRLYLQQIDLEEQLKELKKLYKERHPKIVEKEAELKSVKERIRRGTEGIIGTLEIEYRNLKANEEYLYNTLVDYKGRAASLDRKTNEYMRLENEVNSNREFYNILLHKLRGTSVIEDIKSNPIRIIEKAKVPRKPIKPKKTINLSVGFLLAVTFGSIFAYFREYLSIKPLLKKEQVNGT
ncbi:MAG: GumC family protein [bacterium]|nr:GumC family protein [bacterium]